MAPQLAPIVNALRRDLSASQYKNFRPIAVTLGFALTLLFIYTLRTDSDELVSIARDSPAESPGILTCEAWFEEQDSENEHLMTGRDFDRDPVTIYEVGLPEWFMATEKDLAACDIECRPIPYHAPEARTVTRWDATTDEWPKAPQDIDHAHGFAVIRNVEPPIDFPGLAIDAAHGAGYDIVMTSELASDVPIPYVGVSITDFFAPELPFEKKKRAAMVAISNCGAKSFRLKALEKMQELGIQVDSYGYCNHNKDFPEPENVAYNEEERAKRYRRKVAIARTYMFSLAFENSQYPDYVTEKFFQMLQAGSVPVVIGAPNVGEFAPSPKSFLYLGSLEDVPAVVERMKHLMENRSAYEEMLEWKHHEASDSFKAINDIRGVHHTCRLCIHVATKLQAHEDDEARAQLVGRDQTSALKTPIKARVIDNQNMVKERRLSTRVPLHPCTCRPSDIRPPSGFGVLDRLVGDSEVHRLYVRERGRFRYRPVLMDGTDLSVSALHAAVLRTFQKAQHVPAWIERRKEMGLNWTTWHVYKVHPSGITLRDAMEQGSFTTDSQLREYLRDHPCPKLEVILV